MSKKRIFLMVLIPMFSLLSSTTAFAVSTYRTAFSTQYLASYQAAHPGQLLTIAVCNLCHDPVLGAPDLNPYGTAYSTGHNFTTIAALDSDGDGFSNLTEIMALPQTYPGDPASHPVAAADAIKPLVTAFTIPAAASTLVVPITTLTATDAVGVTGYKVTETAAAPLATAAGWTAAKPANYTFATAGAKTLYGWAKDAAGNVSLSRSAPVTITIAVADIVKPLVTAFAIPATASTLVVPITTLTATDAVGVTGYLVTESATAPLAAAAGWAAAKPANHTFASAGAKTLYGWAKDAAGNVSLSMSAPVTITIAVADIVKPLVTGFAIPATASTLVVPITTLTATDAVGVTGYLVTESATAPLAAAAGWVAAKPANYTFATAGAKTLYGWAKDAAGNVSLSLSAPVTITIAVADIVKPLVTGFAIPATASTLVVPITTLTATDAVGVTGYLVTESATAPLAAAAGWAAAKPANYTFATAGAKTLYGWAKDAAGNVSLSLSAPVTITIAVADIVKPLVTGFAIPATASSLVVPITTLTATDAVGVTGYLVTESATAPLAADLGWAATTPANYTFASAGAKTLYGWAKDATGNVSLSLSAPVTITIVVADIVKPLVTAFTIPATASSLVVPISTLTATDAVGVTGYLVTESATAPLAAAAGWAAAKPANHTFASAGAKTLYGWAKDAAGNVSLSLSAPVTITIVVGGADTVKPLVTAFTIPATSRTLVVPISTFAATDAVGVTGYLVTASATAPLAADLGWAAAKPANYTFVSAGSKALYGWAKDAAGNVSLSKRASVAIVLTDTVKPRVTRFAAAASQRAPLTATITTFSAIDNVKVTGYKLTASATAPKAGARGWTTSRPLRYTFATAGAKQLYAWAKDAAGNVSLSRVANVTVTASVGDGDDAAANSIPLPKAGEKTEFSYAPINEPVISFDPAKSMPIGLGPLADGGDKVDLEARLARFAGPVDVYLYLTLSTPATEEDDPLIQTFALDAVTNTFELISGNVAPWKSGVVELEAKVWAELPVSEFEPGQYKLTLGVTPAGQPDSYYNWTTSFTIK